jgi:hypothetical protein
MATVNIRLDRMVLLASADASLRQRLRDTLGGLRHETSGLRSSHNMRPAAQKTSGSAAHSGINP